MIFLSVHSILLYTKQVSRLVYSTHVHRTSLKYRCTQNQFTAWVYIQPVYSTDHYHPFYIQILFDKSLFNLFEAFKMIKSKENQTNNVYLAAKKADLHKHFLEQLLRTLRSACSCLNLDTTVTCLYIKNRPNI